MSKMGAVMNELEALKEKYKKKCMALEKANKKIKLLQEKEEWKSRREHINHLEWLAMRQMTGHLEIKKYRVKFTLNRESTVYTEENVFSFNKRLIKTAVCKAIAKRNGSLYESYDIKIIKVEEYE